MFLVQIKIVRVQVINNSKNQDKGDVKVNAKQIDWKTHNVQHEGFNLLFSIINDLRSTNIGSIHYIDLLGSNGH